MSKKNAKPRRTATSARSQQNVEDDRVTQPEESAEPDAAAADASPQVQRANEAPAESPEEREKAVLDQLSWIYDAWKRAIEKKDWSTLADLIGLPEIFISGHPENATEVAHRLKGETAKLCDFEPVLGEIYRKQITTDSVRLSFRLDLMWSSSEDWEDHLLDLIVHVGFRLSREAWVTTYLLLERAPRASTAAASSSTQPQSAPPVDAPAPGVEQPPPPAAEPPRSAYESQDRPLTDDQFAEAAALYFARPPVAEGSSSPPPASQTRSKKQLIYVPVLMDADLIRDLLS